MYLPNLHNLVDVGIVWAIGLVMMLAGSAMVGRRLPPEIRIVVGWGAFCLVMTAWGVLSGLSLAIPATAFVISAITGALLRSGLPDRAEWSGIAGLLVLSLPFWLVMAPIRPAEPDTWLNILPNAVYLVDHGVLPAAGRPDAHSFLPAAPYNTQFLAYLGGLVEPDFPAGGMSLVNLLLLVASGGLFARTIAGTGPGEAPGWAATALGILLATGLNLGFVPRIHLAAYGETGLAVTALMAGWVFVEALERRPWPVLALGLVFAAMVEIKQSGFGLVAACAAAGVSAAMLERLTPPPDPLPQGEGEFRGTTPPPLAGGGQGVFALAILAVLPAVLVFLLWRFHVSTSGMDELRPLPFDQWQWSNLPAILGATLRTVAAKGVYFAAVAAAIAALPIAVRRVGWGFGTRFLAFHAALELWYFLFLLLTYVGHFPGAWSSEAHSFYRYETHLSLVLSLALALAVRETGLAARLTPRCWGIAGRIVTVAVLVTPVACLSLLRFDLAMPQPLVWDLAKNLVPYLHDGDRLALLLPGDNGSVATMLGGVLNDTAPVRKNLELLVRDRADAATLAEAAAQGYRLAFVSCTPEGLAGLPAQAAVLAKYDDGTWRAVADWPYPPTANRSRWQHILSWRPLCRAE